MSTKGLEEKIDYTDKMNVIEEYLNVDSSLVEMEKNRDLIRLEMNIVEFPIFSKSNNIRVNQVKKYYFSSDKSSFLEIIPAFETMIPGELEERVFIALTKILRNNKYNQTFYCTINDIFDNMKIENKATRKGLYPKIKKAISKMATTTFRFKNLFYSNEIKKVYDDLIETNMLTFRLISLKDATFAESNFFSDKRVKEVYKITISEEFHENIVKKGYLAFDADELLSIKDSITRSIYTMITKWRYNNFYLKKTAFHIARRIPLAWDNNARRTVIKIDKCLQELKDSNFIKDYKFNKNDKWERADFEIFWDSTHNKIKQDIFYDERATFEKMIHSVEDRQNELDVNTPLLFSDPQFNEILEIFPDVARKMKTLPNVIREALKNHDYKYVKYTAEYTAFQCKASYIKYFKDALLHNWAETYIAKKESIEEKKVKKNQTVIEEAVLVVEPKEELPKHNWEEFLALNISLQGEIEAVAYESFLLEAGSNDNKTMKGIFEKSKRPLILKTMSDYNFEKSKEKVEVLETKGLSKQVKKIEVVEKANKIIKEYASFSHFLLDVKKFVSDSNIEIDLPEVISIFKLLGEYEDFNIKFSYNETTKIGEIIKK